MKHNTIPTLIEAVSRPTKIMSTPLQKIQKHIDDIRMECEHYGIRPERYNEMTLADVMDEINRRRAQQQPKPKTPERI